MSLEWLNNPIDRQKWLANNNFIRVKSNMPSIKYSKEYIKSMNKKGYELVDASKVHYKAEDERHKQDSERLKNIKECFRNVAKDINQKRSFVKENIMHERQQEAKGNVKDGVVWEG